MQGKSSRSSRRLPRRASCEDGQAAVETVLVSLVLLLLFAGAADVGRMFYSYIVITNAAREGARTAARLPCTSANRDIIHDEIVLAALGETDSLPTEPGGEVTVEIDPDPSDSCYVAGSEIVVTVTFEYTNIFTQLVGSGFEMSNSVMMIAFGNDQMEVPSK
jgi:Flp pilus assembly protein TadG